MSDKLVKLLTELWMAADTRASNAEFRIMELERGCICSKLKVRYESLPMVSLNPVSVKKMKIKAKAKDVSSQTDLQMQMQMQQKAE